MKKNFILLLVCCISGVFGESLRAANYTVHEWGTFTSVQGANGELLSWRPLRTSDLPGFVYNWSKPGLNRYSAAMLLKGEMVTLQRMETPVIYFYSAENMSVDVSVAFPKGTITEWYPQASQIGPSSPANTNAASGALSESRAIWKNLYVGPEHTIPQLRLPQDKSGSHYFAARETSANIVQTLVTENGKTAAETDKFIFYRGAGSFKTPLRVSVNTNNEVVVENTGSEPLSHLFLLGVKDGASAFDQITALQPGERRNWLPIENEIRRTHRSGPIEAVQGKLGTAMQAALVSEGLFNDEAKAMINTWKDSWFREEGVRVLYILPRTWTDETLPLTLNPKPEKLVRVMVGRAEVITPNAESVLLHKLKLAANGDADIRRLAASELKAFGRFAEPAMRLVGLHNPSQTNAVTLGFELLNGSVQSKFE